METDKMVDIRMRCIEAAAGPNKTRYDIESEAQSQSYFDWVTSIIPVPIQPPAPPSKETDDEIPF